MAERAYPLRPSPRLTKLTLAGQARMLLPVVAVILLLALAIDFAQHLRAVLARAEGAPRIIPQYMAYRGADILLRQMPIIAIITGFLSEFLRIRRGEATIAAAAGGTLTPVLAAALILGLALGAVQVALEVTLRPASVWAQVELGLGDYDRRFGAREIAPRWHETGDGALRAGVEIGPPGTPPRLTGITHLPAPGSATGAVLIEADAARPVPDAPGLWEAQGVTIWGADGSLPIRAESAQVDLGIDPLRIRYLDVAGLYLPGPDLQRLRAEGPDPSLDTAQWQRLLAVFIPGGFLLVGAGLASSAVAVRGVRVVPLLASLFAAYLATVGLRVFWAMAELGAIPAALGVAAPIVGVWILGAALFQRATWRAPGR